MPCLIGLPALMVQLSRTGLASRGLGSCILLSKSMAGRRVGCRRRLACMQPAARLPQTLLPCWHISRS